MPGVGSVGTTGNQDINGLLTGVGSRGGVCISRLVRVHRVHSKLMDRRDLKGVSSAALGSNEAARLNEL